MAAIDIIANMSNSELIHYYKYCLHSRFGDVSYNQEDYPYVNGVSFLYSNLNNNVNRVFIKQDKPKRKLWQTHEMYLLAVMLDRYTCVSSFSEEMWWEKQMGILATSISYEYYYPHSEVRFPYFQNKIATKKKRNFVTYNGVEFDYIASGLKRKAYYNEKENKVLKIPHNELGFTENKVEAETYALNPNSIYAKCQLLSNGNLIMEYVKPIETREEIEILPNWCHEIADVQVGYTIDNRLVAYDYGSKY